jgi:hypothetical protein
MAIDQRLKPALVMANASRLSQRWAPVETTRIATPASTTIGSQRLRLVRGAEGGRVSFTKNPGEQEYQHLTGTAALHETPD